MRNYLLSTYTAMDIAESDSEKADKTAIATGGLTKKGDLLIFDLWTKRGSDPTEYMKEMFRQMRVYKCRNGLIEQNRAESLLRTLRKTVHTGIYGDPVLANNMLPRIRMIPHYTTSKMDRFEQNIVPLLSARKIWLYGTCEELKEAIKLYPAVEHDDVLDVLDMLIEHGRPPLQEFTQTVNTGNPREYTGNDINAYFANKRTNTWTGVAA